MGRFIITKGTNSKYYFRLTAANGLNILTSEGYANRSDCENGIESVRSNSKFDSMFDRKITSNGKYYFNLKATNGYVIGTSQMYESESGRESGIYSVKVNAPNGVIEFA